MSTECVYSSMSRAIDQACRLAQAMVEKRGRCVLLVPSFGQIARLKRRLAKQGLGFGVAVETPDTWVGDLWELHGDGRELVCSLDRALLMHRAMDGQDVLEKTPGMVTLLSDVARVALPFACADVDLEDPQARCVRTCLIAYRDLLTSLGLLEQSQACEILSRKKVAADAGVIVLGCNTTASLDLILADADVLRLTIDATLRDTDGVDAPKEELDALRHALFHPDFKHPVQATGAVRFELPSGRYAHPYLLVDQICVMANRLKQDADAPVELAVSSKDPQELFKDVVAPLTAHGFDVVLQAPAKYPNTAFGQAWMALRSFVMAGDWEQRGLGYKNAPFASDFDLSLFSFMGQGSAQSLDKRMREWRGKTVDDALTDMAAFADEEHRSFMAAIAAGDVAEALRVQSAWVATRMNWPAAYRMQQQQAVAVTQGAYQRAYEIGIAEKEVLEVLTYAVIPSSAKCAGQGSVGVVRIMNMHELSCYEQGSFDGVVLCDLTAKDYPLKDERRALDYFLESIGAEKHVDVIAAQRASFAQALAAARSEVLLCRCLKDADAEEERPAALFEELVDCYRSDPQNPDELDRQLGLPACLARFAATRGEADLSANAAVLEGMTGGQNAVLSRQPAGILSLAGKSKLLHRRGAGGAQEPLTLSPSGIEAFHECPYKWFADRRLHADGIDADFGPVAFGNFAHAVLEDVHAKLRDGAFGRVVPENVEDAVSLLDAVFDQRLAQELSTISSSSLIPLSRTDEMQVENLRRKLEDFIGWEADFLPDYKPSGLELEFGKDNPFEYAGVLLTGKVDRVDTDGLGHAVVLDYKGNVGQAYNFRVKDAQEWQLPRKVQAAIYAQMVRRYLGMTPAGALYVSYSKPGNIAGVYDTTLLHAENDLLGINADLNGTHELEKNLDRCEQELAHVLERLADGNVQPCPYDADACKYCPVSLCERRM